MLKIERKWKEMKEGYGLDVQNNAIPTFNLFIRNERPYSYNLYGYIYRYTSFFRPYEMLVSRYFNNIYLLRWLSVPKRVYASDTKSRHLSLSSALSSNSSSNVHCIFDNSTENPIKTIHKHILLSITSSWRFAKKVDQQ